MATLLKLTAVLLPGLFWMAKANAVTPPTPQFDILGFVQEATLDVTGGICTPSSDRLRGGTITVNGQKLIVPCNTLLQLPAATMMWADLFDPQNAMPVGTYISAVPANPTANDSVPKTGLALADRAFPGFEVRAQGNVVDGQYIVGLIIPITQQGLNASSGIISYIDYKFGSFRVGGQSTASCDANLVGGGPSCPGALVQINDPVGRWGKVHSPDPRFSGDYENSTVSAATGFPVCIPRQDPAVADDPECPLKNRPVNGSSFGTDPFLAAGEPLKSFTMPTPSLAAGNPSLPDPRKQVPMMIGDQVDYAGTLYKIDPRGPNTAANTYISAHTLHDNLGIFTAPGVPPAYVTVEDILIGTGGAAVQSINQEASTRLTVVGFTTDPTRPVDIFAQDINPCTGKGSLRWLATTDPSTQLIKGRFGHRVLGGDFMPPTRNYVIKSWTQKLDPQTAQPVEIVAANGFVTGQFLLPNFEYIFPENHKIGDPLLPFNFQDMPFLAQGSGPVEGYGSASPIVSQLTPWPGSLAPTAANCMIAGAAPIVNAGADITVTKNIPVRLGGNVSWDANSTPGSRITLWTQTSGTSVGTITDANTLIPTFTPTLEGTITFMLQAEDNIGTGRDTVTVTVVPSSDVIGIPLATWVAQNGKRGSFDKLTVTATSNNPNAILTLTEIGTDGKVYDWGTGAVAGTTATLVTVSWQELKGAQQPVSLTVKSDKGGSLTVGCAVTSVKGTVTCQ